MNKQGKVCDDCKHFNSKTWGCRAWKGLTRPHIASCELFRSSTETLFDQITESPEVLARSLCGNVRVGCFSGYYSMLTGMYYPDMEKAYIATLEKLKEV